MQTVWINLAPVTDVIELIEITYDEKHAKKVRLPLVTKQIIQLQKNYSEVRNIVNKLHKEKSNTNMFILHEGVLCRMWMEERDTFLCAFLFLRY